MTVLSAPVSRMSFAEARPLIVASTTIACPFVNLISVPAAPVAAGARAGTGAFRITMGAAVARYRSGTLSIPWA